MSTTDRTRLSGLFKTEKLPFISGFGQTVFRLTEATFYLLYSNCRIFIMIVFAVIYWFFTIFALFRFVFFVLFQRRGSVHSAGFIHTTTHYNSSNCLFTRFILQASFRSFRGNCFSRKKLHFTQKSRQTCLIGEMDRNYLRFYNLHFLDR